jgi:multiple sugar transport system ATP-binding protein
MMMADVVLKNITKHYGELRVIDRINLHINSGEFVTLLGPSGCGKTTLLRMIAGLESIDEGDLFIGSKRCNTIPAQKRSLAMVFQSYALFPHMNVRNNILFGLRIKKVPDHDIFEKLQWVVPLLGLEGLENRLPKEISGGQRQRVALARALVLDPDVLLLDEPLSNLDTALRELAMEELKRIHHSVGKTIIYVTHNQAEAMSMSERIAVINAGTLEQYAAPMDLFEQPHTTFTAEFIGSPATNMINGVISRQGDGCVLETELGTVYLDKDRALAAEHMNGRNVIISIRPQDIHFYRDYIPRRTSDTQIMATIDLIVPMGDRSIVVGSISKKVTIRFLITQDDEIAIGDEVTIIIDGRRAQLFDSGTHQNIFTKHL